MKSKPKHNNAYDDDAPLTDYNNITNEEIFTEDDFEKALLKITHRDKTDKKKKDEKKERRLINQPFQRAPISSETSE